VKVYFVLQNIKAGSAAERFVRRSNEGTTSSFSKVCEALRTRFGNDEEQAEERRKAEEGSLELRQCRGEDFDDYIKTARRVGRLMASENEHLVATQFVCGLDSRELHVHIMTSLGARPKMNETIIKVRRTSSMLEDELTSTYHKGNHYDYESSSNDDDSGSDAYNSDSERRDRRRRRKLKKERRATGSREKGSRRGDEESKNLRYELAELKKLIQKVQEPTANPSQISSSPTSQQLQSLPFVDTYAINNRLAPPMPPQFGIPPSQHSGSMLPPAAYNYSGYPSAQQWNSGSNQQASGYWQQPSANPAAMRNQQPFEQFPRGPYRQQRTYPRYDRSQVTCFNCGVVADWRTECPLLGYPNSDTANSQFRNEFPPNPPQGKVNSQLWLEQPPTIPIPGVNTREVGILNAAQDHRGQQRIVGPVAGIEIKRLSSALTGMSVNTSGEGNTNTLKEEIVEEIVPGMPSSYTDTKYVGEAMGGERARRHSEVQEISGTLVEPLSQRRRFNYQQPGQDSLQPKVAKQKGKRPPIRIMVD